MLDSLPKEEAPLLLIDESLSDHPIAEALRLVDYNAQAVTEVFGQGEKDYTLIQWLGLRRGIWVTADEKAKRRYAQDIRNAGIHIVWVSRSKDGLSKKAQLLLLLWVVDDILERVIRAKGPIQFKAYYIGKRPKLNQL